MSSSLSVGIFWVRLNRPKILMAGMVRQKEHLKCSGKASKKGLFLNILNFRTGYSGAALKIYQEDLCSN